MEILEEYLFYYKVEKDGLAPIGPLLSILLVLFSLVNGLRLDMNLEFFFKILQVTIILSMIIFLLIPNMKFYSSMILILEAVRSNALTKTTDDLKLDEIKITFEGQREVLKDNIKLNLIYNKLEKIENLIKQNVSRKRYKKQKK